MFELGHVLYEWNPHWIRSLASMWQYSPYAPFSEPESALERTVSRFRDITHSLYTAMTSHQGPDGQCLVRGDALDLP